MSSATRLAKVVQSLSKLKRQKDVVKDVDDKDHGGVNDRFRSIFPFLWDEDINVVHCSCDLLSEALSSDDQTTTRDVLRTLTIATLLEVYTASNTSPRIRRIVGR